MCRNSTKSFCRMLLSINSPHTRVGFLSHCIAFLIFYVATAHQAINMSRVFGPSSFVLFGCAAAFALSDSVGVSHEDRAHQQKAEPQIPTHYQHALSHEELTIEAAKIGLEVVDPVEWEYHGRGLSSEGERTAACSCSAYPALSLCRLESCLRFPSRSTVLCVRVPPKLEDILFCLLQ